MVGEGGKVVMGGCTGVVKESHFVLPELEWCADDGCRDDESDVRQWSVRPRSSELMI